MAKQPKRRWFAFRLRTLLVVMAVLALPLGWAAYCRHWIKERHDAFQEALMLFDSRPLRSGIWSFGHATEPPVEAPDWLQVFGEVGVRYFPYNAKAQSATLDQMRRLFPEAAIYEWSGGDIVCVYPPLRPENSEPSIGLAYSPFL